VAEEVTLAEKFQALTNAGRGATRGRVRQSWVLDSTYAQDNRTKAGGAIQMSLNPSSVKFSQSKRISTPRKTIGGTTYFHWADRNGRNLDQLILSLSGETGPISGLGSSAQLRESTALIKTNGTIDARAKKHGENWARFYTLTAQPAIDPITFKPTVWTIQYKSLLFPSVTFRGFFNSVLDFTDDAANPFSKKWSVGFTVTGVSPNILELENLIAKVNADIATRSAGDVVKGQPRAIA